MTATAVVETRAPDRNSLQNTLLDSRETDFGEKPPQTRASAAGAGQVSNASILHGRDLASLTGGGAVENPSSDYMSQLRYWLNRHKDYPKSARRRRMQGVVYLSFRVTRDGSILTYRIRKSSGFAILDQEAEAMLQRAKPLPRFSDAMRGGYLDITVPVSFSLRGNR
ncbi:MAG: energy transducer TonB [Alphaproteobacteria bacterium]|nr:energy transducer TonB [Alphaproteobacteria bacterium]